MVSPGPYDRLLRDFVAPLLGPGDQAWTPLGGGVSCQAWRVEAGGRRICVKRALPRLAVADDWRAPVGRALSEYRWFETARELAPGAAPSPLAVDAERGFIAMEWLEEESHRLWKGDLLAGAVDPGFAGQVGERLGVIHAGSAARPDLAMRFATDADFFALRLRPYLLTAARRRPAVSRHLRRLAEEVAATHMALVHGDVSPKNIMISPRGPVFLDAETAWWGDPAFDAAFCLNHLLLKTLVVDGAEEALRESFAAFAQAWLARVDWEPPAAAEARAARLLPGLLLARVDGMSPVEYLTGPDQRQFVRDIAEPLLHAPPASLRAVSEAWREALVGAKAAARRSKDAAP